MEREVEIMKRAHSPTKIRTNAGTYNLANLLFDRCDRTLPLFRTKSEVLTRGQLELMVRRLASQFSNYIGPGERVVMGLNDSAMLAASFLACVSIGAIPTIINPRLNVMQVEYICKDCNAKVLVVENHEVDKFIHSPQVETLVTQNITQWDIPEIQSLESYLIEGDPAWDQFYKTHPESPCYLQYTSGSTGQFKGVIHSVKNTIWFCHLFADTHLDIGVSDLIYSVPKMFFGYGMGNSLFFPLYTGAAAVLDEEWPSPERVIANFAMHSPTVFFSVPSMYQMLREHADAFANKIRIAFSAGSPLPSAEFQFWWDKGVEICDGIGATEVGHVYLANAPGAARANRTGRPLTGYECKLLDEQGQVVTASSEMGVLLVKGPGVSKGYWNLSDKTEQRFSDGWYRTGDLFTMDQDGFFEYHGREDDKFKVKGRWVVPAFIERLITEEFACVRESVMVPSTREHDSFKPTLFLSLFPGKSTDAGALEQQINSYLVGRLESYSCPRKVIWVDAMPRNANGKLDRNRLITLAEAAL
jgi:anthranilate-CoA ligase